MIQALCISLLALALIIPLGPHGIRGLSQLSGIRITSGQYYLREDGNGAVIYAQGIKNDGRWEVFCDWRNGLPQVIMKKKIQDGI